jgi:hypothetical protein
MFEMLFDELRRNKLTVENLPNTIFAITEKAILETIRLAYAVRYYQSLLSGKRIVRKHGHHYIWHLL